MGKVSIFWHFKVACLMWLWFTGAVAYFFVDNMKLSSKIGMVAVVLACACICFVTAVLGYACPFAMNVLDTNSKAWAQHVLNKVESFDFDKDQSDEHFWDTLFEEFKLLEKQLTGIFDEASGMYIFYFLGSSASSILGIFLLFAGWVKWDLSSMLLGTTYLAGFPVAMARVHSLVQISVLCSGGTTYKTKPSIKTATYQSFSMREFTSARKQKCEQHMFFLQYVSQSQAGVRLFGVLITYELFGKLSTAATVFYAVLTHMVANLHSSGATPNLSASQVA